MSCILTDTVASHSVCILERKLAAKFASQIISALSMFNDTTRTRRCQNVCGIVCLKEECQVLVIAYNYYCFVGATKVNLKGS